MNSFNYTKKDIIKIILPCFISGIITGLLQTYLDVPMLAFFSLVPFIIQVLAEQNTPLFIMKCILFLYPYYLLSVSFFIKTYNLINIPFILGILLSILVWHIVTMFLMSLTLLPLLVFPKITKGRIIDTVFFSFLFIFGEYLIEILQFLSFPLVRLELGVISFTPFVQISSFFGGRFLGVILVLINALLAIIIKSFPYKRKMLVSFLILIITFSLCLAYGFYKLNGSGEDETINTLILQGNTMGEDKMSSDETEVFSEYKKMLSEIDLSDIDLVLLPETAVFKDINKSVYKSFLIGISKDTNTVIVTGSFKKEADNKYNVLSVIEPNGDIGFYYKQRLVPFGEYTPLGINIGYDSLSFGEKEEVINSSLGKLSTVICVESIYSSLVKEQISDGGEVILVSTNDAWFIGSSIRSQHFRHSILRAIENNRYLLRAANCGISAVINPNGEIVDVISKSETGYIKESISLKDKKSLYTIIGDKFYIISIIILLVGIQKSIIQKTEIHNIKSIKYIKKLFSKK